MNQEEKNITYIIGHKNPDTDSICSAIAYAYFKNQMAGENEEYIPMRAGAINEETRFVLQKFGAESPDYITDVSTQVRDIEIRHAQGVSRTISLKKAWNLLKENSAYTLPVVRSGKLEGIISTEDIAKAYMDVYDSAILSTAHTKYKNIVETLDGEMIEGNPEAYYIKGKVLIAAANPDIMEDYIKPGDLVILGNRYESQLCAIEMHAGCIVICEGAKVSMTIRKLAVANDCTIICSPHDTFTVARLINQSMPISYFMKREGLVTFHEDDLTMDVKAVMAKKRYRDFPILDSKENFLGLMSRRNLLNARKKQIILVDHNEKTQAVDGLEHAQIVEIIDHHRLGNVETDNPVYFRNQPLGCTATIIYQFYQENQVEIPKKIAGLLLSAILSDTLMFRSPTCTSYDKMVAEKLADIVECKPEDLAVEMFRAGSNLADKSAEEIFYQDFKKFAVDGTEFGISQINSMSADELKDIKSKLQTYLDKASKDSKISAVFVMLTNILDESSEVIFAGSEGEKLAMLAFGYQHEDESNSILLKGVVSRKKQLLPKLMHAIKD